MSQKQPNVRILFDGHDITELLELANFLNSTDGELVFEVTSGRPAQAKPRAKQPQTTSPSAVNRQPTPQLP